MAVFVLVEELRAGARGVNLRVVVQRVLLSVQRKQPGGGTVKVAQALVGDRTGCAVLAAVNEQCEALKPGSTVELRGVEVEVFRQRVRLTVDRWGSVAPSPAAILDKVYEANNLSETVYELNKTYGEADEGAA